MFRRSLPDALVAALAANPFWSNVVSNRELHPEIRDGHLTVYCCGRGLMRELCLQNGQLTARLHQNFVPLRTGARTEVDVVFDTSSGFQFVTPPEPLSLGWATPDTFAAYRSRLPVDPEARLVDAIVRHPDNAVLDQEAAFADTRSDRDRVDLVCWLGERQLLAFVEVKRIEDTRLLERGGPPEILDQLTRYCTRLAAEREGILSAYQEVVRLKRRLGLGVRFPAVPDTGPTALLPKPILVIGGCSEPEVARIRLGQGEWGPMIAGLPAVAAGLILCGERCKLVLGNYSHTLCFV